MNVAADDHPRGTADDPPSSLSAGRVGRAHGLDGSFYVTAARPRLLAHGTIVTVGGQVTKIARRAGTDEHPIVRIQTATSRAAAEDLRGLELMVEVSEAPRLSENEWWASELVGCEVVDGERHIGIVAKLLELPSCEALEVQCSAPTADSKGLTAADREGPTELLVPMVSAAIRRVDIERRLIDIDMAFMEETL